MSVLQQSQGAGVNEIRECAHGAVGLVNTLSAAYRDVKSLPPALGLRFNENTGSPEPDEARGLVTLERKNPFSLAALKEFEARIFAQSRKRKA